MTRLSTSCQECRGQKRAISQRTSVKDPNSPPTCYDASQKTHRSQTAVPSESIDPSTEHLSLAFAGTHACTSRERRHILAHEHAIRMSRKHLPSYSSRDFRPRPRLVPLFWYRMNLPGADVPEVPTSSFQVALLGLVEESLF